jgi:hypothetical protein
MNFVTLSFPELSHLIYFFGVIFSGLLLRVILKVPQGHVFRKKKPGKRLSRQDRM